MNLLDKMKEEMENSKTTKKKQWNDFMEGLKKRTIFEKF